MALCYSDKIATMSSQMKIRKKDAFFLCQCLLSELVTEGDRKIYLHGAIRVSGTGGSIKQLTSLAWHAICAKVSLGWWNAKQLGFVPRQPGRSQLQVQAHI